MATQFSLSIEKHLNEEAQSHADLIRFALTDLQCTFNANRREQGVLARQKQRLQADLDATPLPVGKDKANLLRVQIASIDHSIAEIRRDNAALAADIRLATVSSWSLFLGHSLHAAAGSPTGAALLFRGDRTLFVDCAHDLAEAVEALTELPAYKESVVKKLDELIRADAGKTEDRFTPAGAELTARDIPRMVAAAVAATPRLSMEG